MASEENEEVYTEEEANEAMSLIEEHRLPMSDLHYALKYVRILHQGPDYKDPHKTVEDTQAPVAVVEPPEFDDDCESDDPMIREL